MDDDINFDGFSGDNTLYYKYDCLCNLRTLPNTISDEFKAEEAVSQKMESEEAAKNQEKVKLIKKKKIVRVNLDAQRFYILILFILLYKNSISGMLSIFCITFPPLPLASG